MTDLVDVLVVIYNAPDEVERAIASVSTQTYENITIHLLDDGSTNPRIAKILDSWEADDARVRVRRFDTTPETKLTTCTYARNINEGVRDSFGKFVTFLAGDDYYHPDRIERMLNKIHEEAADIVYGSQERPNANGRFVAPLARNVLADAFNQVDMSSVLMTREAFLTAGGFPTAYEDWGDADGRFWRRCSAAGYVFVPVDDPERFTDAKPYRDGSVQERWNQGLVPWQ